MGNKMSSSKDETDMFSIRIFCTKRELNHFIFRLPYGYPTATQRFSSYCVYLIAEDRCGVDGGQAFFKPEISKVLYNLRCLFIINY